MVMRLFPPSSLSKFNADSPPGRKVYKMDRWTIKDLAKVDNLLFAASILQERRSKITPYSPLGRKLAEAIHELHNLYMEKQKD